MPNEDWSPDRLRAAFARLKQEGIERPELEEMAARDQTTVGRWARGERQPRYPNIRDLAWGIWRRYPRLRRLAAELVEASGYPWSEPTEAPEPPRIPPDVLAVIEKRYPDRKDEIIGMLEQFSGHGEATGTEEGQSRSPGGGGTKRAG